MKINDDDVFEKFQYWLVEMDSALESFFKFLPTEMRTELDYTPASVDTLERWLLRKYETIGSSCIALQLSGFGCLVARV